MSSDQERFSRTESGTKPPRAVHLDVTVGLLRREFPKWAWEAARVPCGLGYEYRGENGARAVTVRPYAILRVASEGYEASETEWRVLEGERSTPYVIWSFEEVMKS